MELSDLLYTMRLKTSTIAFGEKVISFFFMFFQMGKPEITFSPTQYYFFQIFVRDQFKLSRAPNVESSWQPNRYHDQKCNNYVQYNLNSFLYNYSTHEIQ